MKILFNDHGTMVEWFPTTPVLSPIGVDVRTGQHYCTSAEARQRQKREDRETRADMAALRMRSTGRRARVGRLMSLWASFRIWTNTDDVAREYGWDMRPITPTELAQTSRKLSALGVAS